MERVKVIIADDHPIFRSGIIQAVSIMSNIEIIGEASNGMEAYHMIISGLPDLAILDLEMPVLSGLDVCKKVLSEKNSTKFIILTMHKKKHYFDAAMAAGVDGYILKDNAVEDLQSCLTAVMSGRKYVSSNIENFLLDDDLNHEIKKINELLTPTEKVILKLIAEGKKSSEIGTLLFSSPNTIDNHRANISKKLKLDGEKNALLKYAIAIKDSL